jgi:ATPase subunit of ABC transporter with duplicated ATPase domains
MRAILEAVDLVVEDAPGPLSFAVGPGEIVGLLFPPGFGREAALRALAGEEKPVRGEVRVEHHRRVARAAAGPSLSDALASQPDVVLLDVDDDAETRATWPRLAGERALGTSIVVATASVDHAFRSDRVAMASWTLAELSRAVRSLAYRMSSEVQEFLAMLSEARYRQTGELATDLGRLNAAARTFLGEMRRQAHAAEDAIALRVAAAQIAGASIDDRVLEALANATDP